jgi:hypothetical protein
VIDVDETQSTGKQLLAWTLLGLVLYVVWYRRR